MKFSTLNHVPTPTLLSTFNNAFSDYLTPTPPMSEELFLWKIQRDGARLDLSAGMFLDDDQLIGFILHAPGVWKDRHIAYNAGTAIIPGHRDKQGGTKMYELILPKLKTAGIKGSLLECITTNHRALHVYNKVGFEIDREVICYKSHIPTGGFRLPQEVSFEELTAPDWDLFQSFWNFHPSWQSSIPAVDRILPTLKLIGILHKDELAGYAILNPKNGFLPQFAISPEFRRQGLGKLLFQKMQTLTERPIALVNVDSQDKDTSEFLKAMDMKQVIQQYEMWNEFSA